MLTLFVLAPVASAEPFGATLNGDLLTLEQLPDPSCGPNQYMVPYAADLTTFSATSHDFITAFGFKVDVDPIAAAVSAVGKDGATYPWGNYLGYWTVRCDQWMNGSAYSCEGSNANSLVRGEVNPFGVAPTIRHTYAGISASRCRVPPVGC